VRAKKSEQSNDERGGYVRPAAAAAEEEAPGGSNVCVDSPASACACFCLNSGRRTAWMERERESATKGSV